MPIKSILAISCFLFISQAFAEKYALVMGGTASGSQATDQEFATYTYAASKGLAAKGYKVSTLFGQKDRSAVSAAASTDSNEPGKKKKPVMDIYEDEILKYKKDYDSIKGLSTYSGALTQANIKNYFDELANKIKAGDTVEIALNAHGHNTCIGALTKKQDNCEHEIDISDENGNPVRLKTKDLIAYVKKLEDKGATINLNVVSCFSGALQDELKQLKNACTFLLAAHNSVGYACMEDDFKSTPPARDFTSTSEALLYRYYKDIAADLKKDPYLNSKKCFNESEKFHSGTGVDYSTVESTFWGARKFDEALHEPFISSHSGESFLNTGLYSSQLMHKRDPVVCEDFNKQLDRFMETANAIQDVALAALAEKLKAVVKSYNDSVTDQKRLIDAAASQDATALEAVRKAQEKTEEIAKALIKAERELVDHVYKNRIKDQSTDKNCKRSL